MNICDDVTMTKASDCLKSWMIILECVPHFVDFSLILHNLVIKL